MNILYRYIEPFCGLRTEVNVEDPIQNGQKLPNRDKQWVSNINNLSWVKLSLQRAREGGRGGGVPFWLVWIPFRKTMIQASPLMCWSRKDSFLWAALFLLFCSPLSPLPVPTHQIPIAIQRLQPLIVKGAKTRSDAGLP